MSIKSEDIHPDEAYKKLKASLTAALLQLKTIPNDNAILDYCPVCRSKDIKLHATIDGFPLSICSDCKLIFCNPYPSAAQLDYCYNADWTADENDLFRATFEKRVPIFLPRIKLIQKFKSAGTLLDIGSSIGIFIEALKRSGNPFITNCCEINTRSCEELKNKYPDCQVINSDFMEFTPPQRFDIVTLWDTIEHIVDLQGALQKIKTLLARDGLLFFSTPNTASFEWLIAGTKHNQLAPPTHVNLLNPAVARNLLTDTGYETLGIYTLNASFDISSVKRSIQNGSVDSDRLGLFLKDALFVPEFEELLERYLVNHQMGGNMVVVARPVQ